MGMLAASAARGAAPKPSQRRSSLRPSSVLVGFDHLLEARELLALVEIDEGHTLCRAAHLANRLDLRADQDAARRDENDLVIGPHEGGRNDLAVACGLLDRDHALRAAA